MKIEFNKDIVSNRSNGIMVHYFITAKDNLINTNVKVNKNNELIYETNVIEKMYDLEYVIKLLKLNGFKIIKAENKILNEVQRFHDKIYIICKKV